MINASCSNGAVLPLLVGITKPLTEDQKKLNREKSKVRCLVEHTFGFMEQTMCGLVFRGVGMVRAKACIAMTNLVYNMCRLVQIKRYHAEWIVEY